jgi:hypothetical protein
VLSLIPKVPGADQISQFRSIALINVIFKIVSKCFATKIDPIVNRVISPNQTTYIKGRLITDGVFALQEVIHELKVKKLGGILLKLDFEKAYDRVNWEFLSEVLHAKGFDPGVVHRLNQLVRNGKTAISINGEILVPSFEIRGESGKVTHSPLCFSTLLSRLYPPCLLAPTLQVIFRVLFLT